jgi:hypothetical protein
MKRWAIRHKPTSKFYCEDESGGYLVDEEDGIFSWGKESIANEWMINLSDMSEDNEGLVFTEMGEYPFEEFEIVEV